MEDIAIFWMLAVMLPLIFLAGYAFGICDHYMGSRLPNTTQHTEADFAFRAEAGMAGGILLLFLALGIIAVLALSIFTDLGMRTTSLGVVLPLLFMQLIVLVFMRPRLMRAWRMASCT